MICIHKIKRAIYRILLPIAGRWENKMWRELYARPRRYCKCVTNKDIVNMVKNNMPSKDMFNGQ